MCTIEQTMGGYCSAYDQHRALVTLGLKKKQRIELDLYYVNEDDEDFIMNGFLTSLNYPPIHELTNSFI